MKDFVVWILVVGSLLLAICGVMFYIMNFREHQRYNHVLVIPDLGYHYAVIDGEEFCYGHGERITVEELQKALNIDKNCELEEDGGMGTLTLNELKLHGRMTVEPKGHEK